MVLRKILRKIHRVVKENISLKEFLKARQSKLITPIWRIQDTQYFPKFENKYLRTNGFPVIRCFPQKSYTYKTVALIVKIKTPGI